MIILNGKLKDPTCMNRKHSLILKTHICSIVKYCDDYSGNLFVVNGATSSFDLPNVVTNTRFEHENKRQFFFSSNPYKLTLFVRIEHDSSNRLLQDNCLLGYVYLSIDSINLP